MPRKDVFVGIAPTTELLDYGACVLRRVIDSSLGDSQRAFIAWGDGANADVIRHLIERHDPAFVFGIGHGSPCMYTVQAREPFLSTCPPMNLDIVRGRVWLLNSCEVGAELGKRIVTDYGAIAFLGSSKPFLFPIVTPPCTTNEVMAPFLAEYRAIELLMRGYSVGEAHKARLDAYDKLIDYYTFGSGNASLYSDLVVRLLEIDRMIAVAYGDMSATVATEKRVRKETSALLPIALITALGVIRWVT